MIQIKITTRATSGDFFVGGVRVGGWRQTAKDVIHADTITGLTGQYTAYPEAEAAVFASIEAWLSSLLETPADD